MPSLHTFHIPVMGTCFSIDTPLKVAQYGISSVISLVDDELIEDVRRYYCQKYGEPYAPITKEDDDHRAKRITAYLNLVDKIVQQQIEKIKSEPFQPDSGITKYFELLPENSPLKSLYRIMLDTTDEKTKEALQSELRKQVRPGEIQVNIMTKLDRTNYGKDKKPLPPIYSDALSALRGFAQSTLNAAIVFSAGFNRRLYSYIEEFKDFYADATGFIKKRIILKVSDFRSSWTQGKFLAKKGLWVSEFRVESGLNCGGHAFPSSGYLLGPILEEFKRRKSELSNSLHKLYNEALKLKNRIPFGRPHPIRITAQGGIGTYEEDQFLLTYYQIDGTGWGSPFLLVPEVTNVDEETLQKLCNATEKDIYLSDVSPLGVPFNNLRKNASDTAKEKRIQEGRPGSSCPKGYLKFNTEFGDVPICIASRQYQKLKLDQLSQQNLPPEEYAKKFEEITVKACLCNDLGEAIYIKDAIPKKPKNLFPAICPGPNIAYFSRVVSLEEMVDHIYGRRDILSPSISRPHMFIKELQVYIEYFKKEIEKSLPTLDEKTKTYLCEFKDNLLSGIEYCRELFEEKIEVAETTRQRFLKDLADIKQAMITLIKSSPVFCVEKTLPSADVGPIGS